MWNSTKQFSYVVLVLSLLGTQCLFGALVIERRVSTSSDDVEQDVANLDVDLGSSDLELPTDGGLQLIGMRFTELDIPADAVILEAWLQFQVDELEGDQPVNLLIEGELSPNPVTFSEDPNNVGARPRTEAKVLWTTKTVSAHHTDGYILDGFVYGYSGLSMQNRGAFKCLDLTTGAEKWSTNAMGWGTCTHVDGHLLCLDIKGKLFLMKPDPERFIQVTVLPKALGDIKGPAWTVPVIANDRLYLRFKQRLVCYTLKT